VGSRKRRKRKRKTTEKENTFRKERGTKHHSKGREDCDNSLGKKREGPLKEVSKGGGDEKVMLASLYL